MRITVIVPVYNEAEITDAVKERLAGLDAPEIIVVDGGSDDGTWESLKPLESPTVRVCRTAETGRARQMNHGALMARGDILLFLHADTDLPRDAARLVAEGMQRPGSLWGRFDVRFDHGGTALWLVARAMNLRSALTSICTGDQALFVDRRVFLALGGFAPVALMEDVELSRRLKRRSRPVRLRETATTSSRRWRRHGVWRTIVLMWRLRWLYWWGVPTSELAARYNRSDGRRTDTFRQDPGDGPGEDTPDP